MNLLNRLSESVNYVHEMGPSVERIIGGEISMPSDRRTVWVPCVQLPRFCFDINITSKNIEVGNCRQVLQNYTLRLSSFGTPAGCHRLILPSKAQRQLRILKKKKLGEYTWKVRKVYLYEEI
ncbi:unnamed protein product [Ilex paraguariensis]|uniref:Uncharacterized protein n=1 Tax=Ilex paraguariensis TaxID=185542 RepID=A0ABC8TIB0_9AQUA